MVSQFVAVFKKLAKHTKCDAMLNDTLGDKLVCGLCTETRQMFLLSESGLMYQMTAEISFGFGICSKEVLKAEYIVQNAQTSSKIYKKSINTYKLYFVVFIQKVFV